MLIVVLLTGIFAYIKESRQASIAREYDKLAHGLARVIRECDEQEVPTEELVIGDIVLLKTGDIVPADCRYESL